MRGGVDVSGNGATLPGRVKGDRHKGRQLMVRMEPELYEAIEADALAEERSMAQTVRFAVKQYLAWKIKP